MRNSRKAVSYVPDIYKGFTEMEQIVNIDDVNIDAAEGAFNELVDNQWVSTASETGIKAYEAMFGIIPDLTEETLQFRRDRLINRFSSRMPFTTAALRQKLDAIIGAENYSLTIDYNQYIIYLQSSSSNQVWYTETMLTISGMKPCNMVFINNPLISSGIKLSETIYFSSMTHNYTLGNGFKLGMNSFSTVQSEKVIKMDSTPSITRSFLEDVATFSADNIAVAIVEGTDGRSSVVADFTIKSASNNLVTIEYDVPESITDAVTSIELYDVNGVKLSSCAVYIPVATGTRIKHTILVKEG